jgi:hypothetical protein
MKSEMIRYGGRTANWWWLVWCFSDIVPTLVAYDVVLVIRITFQDMLARFVLTDLALLLLSYTYFTFTQ